MAANAGAPPAKAPRGNGYGIRPGNAEDVWTCLLSPKEDVRFLESKGLDLADGRDLWLVGTCTRLREAAGVLAEKIGNPAVRMAAEQLQPEPAVGASRTVSIAGSDGKLLTLSLVAMPESASRTVCPARPDIIGKLLHGKLRNKDVVLCVDEPRALAAGLAVARCLPPFSAKSEGAEPRPVRVFYHGFAPTASFLDCLNNMARSIRMAQGLVDMPPNFLTTMTYKSLVLKAVEGMDKVTSEVIEGAELDRRGYGGLWNVGKVAPSPPCLVRLTHVGSKGNSKGGVALVGKGITYDTGGAAIKPKTGMCGMKRDMGGSAGVFGAWLAMARQGGLRSGEPLHLVLCIAENAVGPEMFLHDDIFTQYSGLTTEVNNTDAEGRLVLADGVAHATRNLGAELIVDMATLTGAQSISTGANHALILASDEALERDVVAAGLASGDGAHPGLFAPELLLQEFDSKFADMKNSVNNRNNAQSSCAGLFIYRHLMAAGHKGRWLHVDMAEPSYAPLVEHGTGYGVGLLCKYLGLV